MKHIILFFVVFQVYDLNAQNKFVGKYFNNMSDIIVRLSLKEDYSFEYSRSTHMGYDEGNGKFIILQDTVYLNFHSDTIKRDSGQIFRMGSPDAIYRPSKLLFSNDKLYAIDNGKIKRRIKQEPAGNFIKTSDWKKWYRKKYYLFGSYITKNETIYYVKKINQ